MSATEPVILAGESGPPLSAPDLLQRGFGPEARFVPILQSDQPVVVFTALLQALWADQTLTLLDPGWGPELLREMGIDPRAVNRPAEGVHLSPPARVEALRERMTQNPPGQVILYSSGTTGWPRPVRHTLTSLARGIRIGPRHRNARWALTYEPTHMAGIQVFLQAFLNGNPIYSLRHQTREEIVRAITTGQLSHLSATPTFYRLLLPVEPPMEGVSHVACGGERMEPPLEAALRKAFPRARLLNLYATTEAGSLFAAEGEVFTVPGALREYVRVEQGQLCIHRQLLGTLTPADTPLPDWQPTGDLVEVLSPDPLRLRILGRVQGMVKVGGYPVVPEQVEALLRQHPGVRDVRVHARPNSVTGYLLVAEVLLMEGIGEKPAERELRDFLQKQLPPPAIPRRFCFVDRLKISRSGKGAREICSRCGA